MSQTVIDPTLNVAQKLFSHGKTVAEIEKHLKENEHLPEHIEEAVIHIKNMRNEKERRIGFPLIALGAVLCVTGFIIVVLTSAESITFNVALYGVTGLGATTIMGGLFTILG